MSENKCSACNTNLSSSNRFYFEGNYYCKECRQKKYEEYKNNKQNSKLIVESKEELIQKNEEIKKEEIENNSSVKKINPESIKEVAEEIEKSKQKSKHPYARLLDYVCYIFQLDAPTGMMMKQIKECKLSGGTYEGMEYTLWYCVEILGKPPIPKYGVYFIKDYYEEAAQYWKEQNEIANKMKDVSESDFKIKKVQGSNKSNINVDSSLFNLDNIME